MDKKFIVAITFALLLFFLNIYTLNKKQACTAKMQEAEQIYDVLKYQEEIQEIKGAKISRKFSEKYMSGKAVRLVALFPKEYCNICMEMEIPWLEKIADNYPGNLLIDNADKDYDLLSIIGNRTVKEIPFQGFLNESEINLHRIKVPIIFLIDKHGIIHDVYINDYRKPYITDKFYEKTISLLSLI
ncbi:hypothetical protein SAMN06265219_11079 [Gracilimonas mengyeensis]|uniref:Thioredoxin domain-containing protein n=2 Tax=Gracilimonas mengyeensis TaxID=1302730 RepID=A0A521E3K1_9BACT|nr:hypothetical protein SAMN06265219_11079 [Gracilimonas mengyeensis]